MLNINYNRLYYFHVVATAGSQTAAARALGSSQSTVSEQVSQLEHMLGVELFERSSSGMRLTSSGQRCFEFTEVMFSAAERLLQAFAVRAEHKAVLEITVASSVSRSVATQTFLPLLDAEGHLPRIRHGAYTQLIHQLKAREVDLVLASEPARGPIAQGITSRLARRLPISFMAAPRLAASVTKIPGGLAAQPFLQCLEASSLRLGVGAYFRQYSVVPDIGMETDDLDLIRLAAREGRGVCALPERMAHDDLAEGALVNLGSADFELELYLSYLDEEPTELVRRAIDLLVEDDLG